MNCREITMRTALKSAYSGGSRLVGPGLLLDAVSELGYLCINRAALGHQTADLAIGVDHRGVVPAAELLADLGQRHVGQLAAQVHGDMPGGDEHPRPAPSPPAS